MPDALVPRKYAPQPHAAQTLDLDLFGLGVLEPSRSTSLNAVNASERRARTRTGVASTHGQIMPMRIVLFNGLELTDEAPGLVGRYRQLRTGAWLAARVLLYVYVSFPRLWRPGDVTDSGSFQYKWRSWVDMLEQMAPGAGAWSALAAHLVSAQSPPATHTLVSDIARASIELAMRDAEIERNSLRAVPTELPLMCPLMRVPQSAPRTSSLS
eukprot:IDg15520t1